MPDPYTYPAKPTNTSYVGISAEGRQVYDEALIAYDDSATYYDSMNENAYTSVSKPTGSIYTFISKPT
jgi:hypothetical protein